MHGQSEFLYTMRWANAAFMHAYEVLRVLRVLASMFVPLANGCLIKCFLSCIFSACQAMSSNFTFIIILVDSVSNTGYAGCNLWRLVEDMFPGSLLHGKTGQQGSKSKPLSTRAWHSASHATLKSQDSICTASRPTC